MKLLCPKTQPQYSGTSALLFKTDIIGGNLIGNRLQKFQAEKQDFYQLVESFCRLGVQVVRIEGGLESHEEGGSY